MVSNTFCVLPWIHLNVSPVGEVFPCAIGNHAYPLANVQTSTIKEIWNNDQFKSLRLKMLKGERCNECSACNQAEDNGITPARHGMNKKFQEFVKFADSTNEDGSLDFMDLKYLDIRWSNICNFKCRTCNGTYSSSWASEDVTKGHKKKVFIFSGGDNNDLLYDQLLPHMSTVKEIYFAGGEPLLMDKHYDMLEQLIKVGNTGVKIRYNTNLSNLQYKDKSVIDLWKHFDKVKVYASIDSWGDRAEYIREGTEWQVIENNIRLINSQTTNVDLEIGIVISALNIYTLPEFFNYVYSNNLFNFDKSHPSFYNIIDPTYYSVSIFNDTIKQDIIKKLSSVSYNEYVNQKIKEIIINLESSVYNSDIKDKFLNRTAHFDKLRNKDFRKTFPELRGILND